MNVDLSVNKLVVYQTKASEFKGFLLKDNGNYSIKVIEVTRGVVRVDDVFKLKVKDLANIVQSEYPKLMAVSMKSWHYRLVKYVLGSSAPTPKTMHNGCPYFWLLIFSLIASPFVLLGGILGKIFTFIFVGFERLMDALVDQWLDNLDASEIYDYSQNGGDFYNPNIFTRVISGSKRNAFDRFVFLKYGIDKDVDSDKFREQTKIIFNEWREWRRKQYEKQSLQQAEYQKSLAKKRISDEKWNKRTQPIKDGIAKALLSIEDFFTNIKKSFTGNNNLVKRTKEFVGLFVTILMLAITLGIVSGVAVVIVMISDALAGNWFVIFETLICLIVIATVVLIAFFLAAMVMAFVDKCKNNRNAWYSKILLSAIFAPIVNIGKFIAYGLFYVVFIPLKFIIFDFLWKIVYIKIIAGTFIGLFNVTINSGGIFTEYFKASYSDYCPGIEWVDTDDEKKI
jgi:hypothetical protein